MCNGFLTKVCAKRKRTVSEEAIVSDRTKKEVEEGGSALDAT